MCENIEINEAEITIESSDLTKQQKSVVLQLYNKFRENLMDIINTISTNNLDASSITQHLFNLICFCIKVIEKVKINKKPLTGGDKKLIVLELIRVTINSEVKNTQIKTTIITIFDSTGEAILENVIDVSRSVNMGLKKGCNTLLNCCRN